MEYETLLNFYNELTALTGAGKNEDAQKMIQKRFAELPEDVQAELLTHMYFRALEERVEETQMLGHIQEKGLEELKELEILKKKLDKGRK
jgi:hypothetical protein